VASRIAHPEDGIQAAAVEHIRRRGVPGLVFFHVPNSSKMGGKRTRTGVPLEAIRLKRLGFRKGVSDLVFIYCARIFILELKAPGNTPTKEQREFLADAAAQGATVAVATGLIEALRVLEGWMLLRGSSF
jgi:hypothetical protein